MLKTRSLLQIMFLILLILPFTPFDIPAAVAQTQEVKQDVPFKEEHRIEVIDDNGGWSFKNIGEGKLWLKATMQFSSTGAATQPIFEGFYSGTVVVAGKKGFTHQMKNPVDGFQIDITSIMHEGAEIQIRKEGTLRDNLEFIQNGKVTSKYSVKDSKGASVASGTRAYTFKNGKLASIELNDQKGPSKIKLSDGGCIDVKSVKMDRNDCAKTSWIDFFYRLFK